MTTDQPRAFVAHMTPARREEGLREALTLVRRGGYDHAEKAILSVIDQLRHVFPASAAEDTPVRPKADRYQPGHFDGDGCHFPAPGHFADDYNPFADRPVPEERIAGLTASQMAANVQWNVANIIGQAIGQGRLDGTNAAAVADAIRSASSHENFTAALERHRAPSATAAPVGEDADTSTADDASTEVDQQGTPITLADYREGYQAANAFCQTANNALIAIWRMATPWDTSEMTYGEDPETVVQAVSDALAAARNGSPEPTDTENLPSSKPHTREAVESTEQLDALPVDSAVLFPPKHTDLWGYFSAFIAQKRENPRAGGPDEPEHLWFLTTGDSDGVEAHELTSLPAAVVYRPDRPADESDAARVERAARAWAENGPTPATFDLMAAHRRDQLLERIRIVLEAADR